MGFMDTLLGFFGVGQPEVSLVIDHPTLKQGQLVKGTITVVGGKRDLPLKKVRAELIRKTKDGDMTNHDFLCPTDIFMGDLPLVAGGRVEVDFVLQVPKEATPTSGDVSYEISAKASVPGLNPGARVDVEVSGQQDPMAEEDFEAFHLLKEQKEFRHSSVRGDFRLYKLPGGTGAGWKDVFVARNEDGSERWRLNGFGIGAELSPDGSRLAITGRDKALVVVDPATGDIVAGPVTLGHWIKDVVWTEDGTLVAVASDAVYVLDAEANVQKSFERMDDGREDPTKFYLSSAVAGPGRTVILADSNDSALMRLSIDDGKAEKIADPRYPSTLYRSGDGSRYVVDSDSQVYIYDPDFQSLAKFKVPGKRGVRYLGQSEHSYNAWKPMARLAPDASRVLLNDRSGLLWLLDAAKGKPVRQFTREALPYVEDTLWLDDHRFAVLTNDGRFHLMGVHEPLPTFSASDL